MAKSVTAKAKSLTLPPPKSKGRNPGRKVLLSLQPPLYGRLEKLSKERGEPVATVARILVETALEALGR